MLFLSQFLPALSSPGRSVPVVVSRCQPFPSRCCIPQLCWRLTQAQPAPLCWAHIAVPLLPIPALPCRAGRCWLVAFALQRAGGTDSFLPCCVMGHSCASDAATYCHNCTGLRINFLFKKTLKFLKLHLGQWFYSANKRKWDYLFHLIPETFGFSPCRLGPIWIGRSLKAV